MGLQGGSSEVLVALLQTRSLLHEYVVCENKAEHFDMCTSVVANSYRKVFVVMGFSEWCHLGTTDLSNVYNAKQCQKK